MSAFSSARRREVVERAGDRCEYCRLPQEGQVATFPIDHIAPKSAGGSNELENIALTCPHCNSHKWSAVESIDPETGLVARLFNPRIDAWDEHFQWPSPTTGVLIGKSAIGRCTIQALEINATTMVRLRILLSELGMFAYE